MPTTGTPLRPMLDLSAAEAIVDVKDAAEYAGLTYVSDEKPGIRRRRKGKGFWYENAQRRPRSRTSQP